MFNWGIIILIFFLLATFFKIELVFWSLYFFLGLYLVIRFWNHHALKNLTCERVLFHNRAFLGEELTVQLCLTNNGFLPVLWVKITEYLPYGLGYVQPYRSVVTILPRRKIMASYRLYCRSRGYYRLGPLSLEMGDILGIEERKKEWPKIDHFIVYPRIVFLSKLGFPSREPFGTIRWPQRLFEDPLRVIGVRDYQQGDGLRRIHWKISARTQSLQVKKYGPSITMATMIFLNLNREEYKVFRQEYRAELGITTAASLANYLCQQKQFFGLSTNGWDTATTEKKNILPEDHLLRPPVSENNLSSSTGEVSAPIITLLPSRGQFQLMGILEILARVKLASTFSFLHLLEKEIVRIPWGATLIVITPTEDENILRTLFRLKKSGFNIVLVLNSEPFDYFSSGTKGRELGLGVHRIEKEEDLRVWQIC